MTYYLSGRQYRWSHGVRYIVLPISIANPREDVEPSRRHGVTVFEAGIAC
ncbi:hypothetical protein WN55_04779 [Dufourea novaeangliae]|uniref:Uncharacterized protein n=1 Tax=Dufourea novaeangliae TaxID=178035 RepID=A0A154P1M1_DUFNO|nr:hypothetical protein WN55_04779 [Dufourea novaeangliae]